MPRVRFPAGAAVSMALIALCFFAVPATASDSTEALKQAIKLFNDGDYLAAQETLLGIDRDALSQDDQARRDDYVSRVQVAITMYEKSLGDLEDAETAIAEREYDRAEKLLNGVLANEYSAESVRRAATAKLRDLRERDSLIEESTAAAKSTTPTDNHPAHLVGDDAAASSDQSAVQRAADLTAKGNSLVEAGRYADAEEAYREALVAVPGYPEAVDGLNVARQHAANAAGPGGQSLIDRIRHEDAINWQRAVARYREAENAIRDCVANEQFDEANQILIRARQIVESGRQFAEPVVKYESLRSEYDALEDQVRAQERRYHEEKVAETRREIEDARQQHLREVEANRTRQVDALMQQAQQHRKDGDLPAAINALRQITVIDPKNKPARFMMDVLEDQRLLRREREIHDDFYRESRNTLIGVEEAKIPWHQQIQYPDDWIKIISRPERSRPGETRQDSLLISALNRPTTADFQRQPFGQVIERLADAHRLNISVNWHDLQQAGVERDTPIELVLPSEITLKKVLTEVLQQAGQGTVDVGFEVAEGVISIATQDFLDQRTYNAVYDITDLLMEIPDFTDAPAMDLHAMTNRKRPRVSEEADLPWQVGDDDDDEPESNPARESRVRKLISLIQDTIAPESWYDNGGSIGRISEINGQLVVTQNSASHAKLSGLLDKLRAERAIQVAVEALFITVSSHYLEELGMNLNITLNSGNAGFDMINGGSGPLTDPVYGNRLLLPRTFSQLGITPTPLGQGEVLQVGGSAIQQPYEQPYLVPGSTGGGGSLLTPVPVTSSVLDFTNPANFPSDIPGSFGGQALPAALSIFGSFLDNIQLDFLIRATQADSRTSVVTAPRLVVFNGASAWIAVTIQQNFVSTLQPVVAQQAVAQEPETQTVDAGASLFVRATVTADRRYVMMLLAPGVTRLLDLQTFRFSGGTGAGDAFVQLPTLSAQRIQTMVSVPDGGTLLIGGQKLASETEVEAGVPILSKIPILKRLYSSRSTVKDEQVLLILIKPKILIQSEQEEQAFPSFSQR